MPENYGTMLDLEARFEQYLNLVQLKKRDIHPVQLQETRRAFMGGMGIMLNLVTKEFYELTDDACMIALDKLMENLNDFWQAEKI